jgi:hypothetical protein
MAINPTTFYIINIVDTCAVWNVLRSDCLYRAALLAKCHFAITQFVNYECLHKPRSGPPLASDLELRSRLTLQQSQGRFAVHSCDIDDLQSIVLLQNRQRLGKGELSSIAFAMKNRQAVLTDDQRARKLATQAGHTLIQTTPHLFAWLVFEGRLGNKEKEIVIAEHVQLDGILKSHLETAYGIAMQYL